MRQAYLKQWQAANPDKVAKHNAHRTERKRQKRREAGVPERKAAPPEVQQQRQKDAHERYALAHPDRVAKNIEDGRVRQWNKRREKGKVEKPILPPELRKERRQQTKADWQNSNRELLAQRNAIRYVKRLNYVLIKELSGPDCYICCKPMLPTHKLHYDHVIPIAMGGEHSEDNVRLVHALCNQRKHARLLSQMTQEQRRGLDC